MFAERNNLRNLTSLLQLFGQTERPVLTALVAVVADPSLWWFYKVFRWRWLKTLKRRSQESHLNSDAFPRLTDRFFLPIRLRHTLSCHRFDATGMSRTRCACMRARLAATRKPGPKRPESSTHTRTTLPISPFNAVTTTRQTLTIRKELYFHCSQATRISKWNALR